jgi:hypothetical protein
MTDAEIKSEWTYRYEERLGILCGKEQPTEEQKRIAKQEADGTIAEITLPSLGL